MAVSIARWYKRERLELTLEFVTPAFLGNWEQKSELRAAPFKALFRYWWRVVEGHRYETVSDLFKAESALFGSAVEAGQSQVQITIESQNNQNIEVDALPRGRRQAGPAHPLAYIGFGRVKPFPLGEDRVLKPVRHEERGGETTAVPIKAINVGARVLVRLSIPSSQRTTLLRVLLAIDQFGTIGGRCSNGWGSLLLRPNHFSLPAPSEIREAWRPLTGFFGRTYPSGLALDEDHRPLWWKLTGSGKDDWVEPLCELAEIYRQVRKSLPLRSRPDKRHLLGYPVTDHEVPSWESNEWKRHASPLRLMVKRVNGTHQGYILHLPYQFGIPHDVPADKDVWSEVHQELDSRMDRMTLP
jgi:CRISPR-associated protein Cmr1